MNKEIRLTGSKLTVGDKTIHLNKQQLKDLGIELNPFHIKDGDSLYYIDTFGKVDWVQFRHDDKEAVEMLKSGKICKDEDLMEQKKLRQNLNDLLWKFTNENGYYEKMWEEDGYKWFIANDYSEMKLRPMHDDAIKAQGTTYFISEEIAQKAIEEIVIPYMKKHPEFIW